MSEQGISERKDEVNDIIGHGTEENATSGKTKRCKIFKIINSHEKYASLSIYILSIDSKRKMTTYGIHVVSNV